NGRARHAQTGLAGVSDRAADVAVDRGECEAAGLSEQYFSSRHCERSEAIHSSASGGMDCFVAMLLAMKRRSAPLRQPPHHLVELFEVAVADLDGAAGVAVVDGHGKTERIAHPLFQRDRVGILDLPTAAAGLLRLALRHALFMCQCLCLA